MLPGSAGRTQSTVRGGRQGSHSGEPGLPSADPWEVGACRVRRFEVRVSGGWRVGCCSVPVTLLGAPAGMAARAVSQLFTDLDRCSVCISGSL